MRKPLFILVTLGMASVALADCELFVRTVFPEFISATVGGADAVVNAVPDEITPTSRDEIELRYGSQYLVFERVRDER